MIAISTLQFGLHLCWLLAWAQWWAWNGNGDSAWRAPVPLLFVAAGAAAFVMCGLLLNDDPSARGRIVSYVVSGVGFLGAGVIFKDGGNVRGLIEDDVSTLSWSIAEPAME
jgi:putative Mg2+ transporter-C (MgtC) family protein